MVSQGTHGITFVPIIILVITIPVNISHIETTMWNLIRDTFGWNGQLKWDPLITYAPGSDKNSIIIFLSVIFLLSCLINHTTNLGSIHCTLHPLLTIIANIGPVIIIIMIFTSIVINFIFIIILHMWSSWSHVFTCQNRQAGNPTLVNVPLCLDLTLNWLLNVYDWWWWRWSW